MLIWISSNAELGPIFVHPCALGQCVQRGIALWWDFLKTILANIVHFKWCFLLFKIVFYCEECLLLECAEQSWHVLPRQRRECCFTFIPGSLLSTMSEVTAAHSVSQLCWWNTVSATPGETLLLVGEKAEVLEHMCAAEIEDCFLLVLRFIL